MELALVKPESASGPVTLFKGSHRGFAANDPRWHQGCEGVLLRWRGGVLYVQSDPIGLDGGTNTYGYSFQNPIGSFDPKGLYVCSCTIERNGGPASPSLLQRFFSAPSDDFFTPIYKCRCFCEGDNGKSRVFEFRGDPVKDSRANEPRTRVRRIDTSNFFQPFDLPDDFESEMDEFCEDCEKEGN